jgi:KDO2-lipid IV(A) lauroyltransferase
MFLVRALARLPLPLLHGLARPLALLLRCVVRYRRSTVRANLAAALPERDAAERRRIERAFYGYLADLALESVAASRLPAQAFSERVTFSGLELLYERLRDHAAPVIVLVIHQGNWEWMLQAAAVQLDLPIRPVYKPLHSASWDDFARELRSRFGSEPVPMQRALRDLLRHRGQRCAYVLLADQSASRRGYWTRFLHRDAAFYRGPGHMAQAVDAPVLFLQCRRLHRGHYDARFHALADPPHALGEEALIDRYVALAETFIREQPETYLWSSRRWRRQRPAA